MTPTLAGLFTVPEIRHLLAKLIINAKTHPAFVWAWSRGRRAHHTAAALCHRKQHDKTQL